MKTLKNEFLTISVKEHGAELASIQCGGREYLWQADPAFWKRHSPVLFPIVGSVWDGKYRVEGKEYSLGQHGFARDMDFKLLSESEDVIMFELESNEDTLLKYPYPFRLEIGYRLRGKEIDVIWRVINPADREMFFQIGAHPAFYWPSAQIGDTAGKQEEYGYFQFDTQASALTKSVIVAKGCIDPSLSTQITLEQGGMLKLSPKTFERDALVFEHNQVHRVTLLDVQKNPYLALSFEAPLVGLWSPPGKNAPFVCIEPWYGRCDRICYDGEYKDKDWVQKLAPGAKFEAQYTITIL